MTVKFMMKRLSVSGHFIIFGLVIMISNWSQFSNRVISARSYKFVQTGFMSVLSLLIYSSKLRHGPQVTTQKSKGVV